MKFEKKLVKTVVYTIVISLLNVILSPSLVKGEEKYDKWAVVIGISKYEDPQVIPLKYADNDAIAIQQVLREKGKFPADHIMLLINSDATRKCIRETITGWLGRNAKTDDLVVIYFSGHGSYAEDKDGDEPDGLDEYLLPYDVSLDDETTGIVDDIFGYWVRRLRSNKVVLIFDSCYGGAVVEEELPKFQVFQEVETRVYPSDQLISDLAMPGTIVISSGKGDQISQEKEEFHHGIFTYYFLEALKGAADEDLDGTITVQEAFRYTKRKVEGEVTGQTPQIIDNVGKKVYLIGEAKGYVITTFSGGQLIIDIGSEDGVQPGDEFNTYRLERLTHPETKEMIIARIDTGAIRVTKVREDLSYALIIQRATKQEIEKGNKIEIREKVEEVSGVIPPEKLGGLLIRSLPSKAKVYIDGEYVGETIEQGLIRSDLSPGSHEILIIKEGYENWSSVQNVYAGAIRALDVIMKKIEEEAPPKITPTKPRYIQSDKASLPPSKSSSLDEADYIYYALGGVALIALLVVISNKTSSKPSNVPPVALASANPQSGIVPLEVAFKGKGTDADGEIVKYAWDFGDGSDIWESSTTGEADHTYTEVGTYIAKFTVTDDKGAEDTDTVSIVVAKEDKKPPRATADADPKSGKAPLKVEFTGEGYDEDGWIAKYEWDFNGDGIMDWESDTTGNTSYTYTAPNSYLAKFRVTDNDGLQSSTIGVNINVIENSQPSVKVEAPNGGEVWSETQEILWTATDPDGDPLKIAISYSISGGAVWDNIATDIDNGGSYDWDTTTCANGSNYLIKVTASDGYLSGEDQSDGFFSINN